MSYIMQGMYLGGVCDAWKSENLKKQGITHILTVDGKPLPLEVHQGFQYMYVHALDMAGTDILSHFQESFNFIEQGRQAGGVLVHCYAGVSRSATIVIAYVMNKMQMGVQDSLELVKCNKGDIRPNSGFMEQLDLFEDMGCRIDNDHKSYKWYKLNNLSLQIQSAKLLEGSLADSLSADPSLVPNIGEIIFKCRKCRRPLFKQSGILPHAEGEGEKSFTYSASNNGPSTDAKSQCTRSLFVEPVQWMENNILQINGKLTCPKCAAKLGSYNWVGEKCPCGTWVTPAFHIQTGKVDRTCPRLASTTEPGYASPLPKQSVPQAGKSTLPLCEVKNNPVADIPCDVDKLSLEDS